MDFQKPQNNNNNNTRKMMMLMREKSTQKSIKHEDHEEQGSDDNMGAEEEDEINLGRSDNNNNITEEKKQKRLGSGRRVGGGGGGGIACQAEKCSADLTDAKRYHRRHKVCELHAKAPCVLVSGLRQRFCQQCSRFHELSEFDEAKRSCRRRLAGHNERRRKNSSEPQGEGGGSSSRGKAANPQCRPVDHERASRAQISSYPTGNPGYKHFQIR